MPLLFNFSLKYTIKKVHENQEGIEIEWKISDNGLC
jgi:hypothetical protein